MKKSERLWVIVLLLKQHGKLTAYELANNLEVTKRTIYRDIDALSQMGIPIISEEGVSGGYSLVPDYFLPCIHLYDKEIILLELLLKMSPQFQLLDFEEETKSLNLKLSHICKKNDSMKNAFSKIYFSVDNIVPISYVKGAFETILRALNENNQLNISYYTPIKNTVIDRKISPIHFLFCDGCWYLNSYCELRKEARMFRLDRITKVEYLKEKIPTCHVESFNKSTCSETVLVSLEIEHNLYNIIKDDMAMQNIVKLTRNNNILILDLITHEISYFENLAFRNAKDVNILSPEFLKDSILKKSKIILEKYIFQN